MIVEINFERWYDGIHFEVEGFTENQFVVATAEGVAKKCHRLQIYVRIMAHRLPCRGTVEIT